MSQDKLTAITDDPQISVAQHNKSIILAHAVSLGYSLIAIYSEQLSKSGDSGIQSPFIF